jgi:hypothetical protein
LAGAVGNSTGMSLKISLIRFNPCLYTHGKRKGIPEDGDTIATLSPGFNGKGVWNFISFPIQAILC